MEQNIRRLYISVAGLIGVGKTSFCRELSSNLEVPGYFEHIDAEIFGDFYKDMKANSFELQMYLLNSRFRQQQEILMSKTGAVQDRSIYEDTIFAKMLTQNGLMTPRNLDTYLSLFKTMNGLLPKPDLIIYLRADPEICLNRIKSRGRPFEKEITIEYMKTLYNMYEEAMLILSLTMNIITIDWNEFQTSQDAINIIIKKVTSKIK